MSKDKKENWHGRAINEFAYYYDQATAIVQTADSIKENKPIANINWENVYKVCKVISQNCLKNAGFKAFCDDVLIRRIESKYSQLIQDAPRSNKDNYCYYLDNKSWQLPFEKLLALLCDGNCLLTSVILNVKHLEIEEVVGLVKTLQHDNCKLRSIDICGNNLGDEGVRLLAEILHNPSCQLTSIGLVGNHIGNEGACILARSLQNPHCKLKALDFGCNEIGNDGANALAEALGQINCSLTSLGLWSNQIGDEGAIALARAAQKSHCKLDSLELWNNQIAVEGGGALVEALQQRDSKLTLLDFAQNKFGSEEIKFLIKNFAHVDYIQDKLIMNTEVQDCFANS